MSDDFTDIASHAMREAHPAWHEVTEFKELMPLEEVAQHIDFTPDGHEVQVTGDTEGDKQFNHLQGDNDFEFRGTCGLVSCEDVLRQHGLQVTENDVVHFAVDHGLCAVTSDSNHSGGTTPELRAALLTDLGVPAHAEQELTPEMLAGDIEGGKSVIISVNAGMLFDEPSALGQDPEMSNHAVVVTGIAHDVQTGEIIGIYINDSGGFCTDGTPGAVASGHFVDMSHLQSGWTDTGGAAVVTDVVRPATDSSDPHTTDTSGSHSREGYWSDGARDTRYTWQ